MSTQNNLILNHNGVLLQPTDEDKNHGVNHLTLVNHLCDFYETK